MALEFRLKDKEKGSELFIDAQNSKGDRIIWFTMVDKEGVQHDFDVIQQEELIDFALFLNQKLGFELCDKYDINKIMEEDFPKPELKQESNIETIK